jgi:signal transduction histidine kinase
MPGDAGRLAVALESLISNAVRYNDPPKEVWIRYRESPENHYIMVCDNGRGIPKEKIRSIFDPFYIGDACDQDKKGGGVGLSLSIANRYVRLHGGEITVASQVGEGSTFTIRIPKEV